MENSAGLGKSIKCELLPEDVDLKLQASGIVAVGETDVQLKFGESGKLSGLIKPNARPRFYVMSLKLSSIS